MKNINEDIKNNELKQVYLLYGTEDYLKFQYRDKLIKVLNPTDDTMNLTWFQEKNFQVQEAIDMGQTIPFFAEHRILVLQDTGMFKNQSQEMADYILELPDYLYIIFVESQVDKRNRLYKSVTKVGRAAEFGSQDEKLLTRWVLGMLSKENKKITQKDMEHFLTLTGSDMSNIENETQKLIDYTLGREVITEEDIDNICSGQITNQIFEMIKALTLKEQKKALDLYYDLLALKEPPMRILFLIARQFNLMMQAKELMSNGYDAVKIAPKIGVQTFVARNYCNYARQYKIEDLRNAVELCTQLEEDVKTGKISDVLSVELLIIKFSS